MDNLTEFKLRPPKMGDYPKLLELTYIAQAQYCNLLMWILCFPGTPIILMIYLFINTYIICEHTTSRKVVGFISFHKVPFKEQAILPYFSVDREFREMKIGTTLMVEALNQIKERGFKKVLVSVNYDNVKARRLLEKQGFILKKGRVVYELKI